MSRVLSKMTEGHHLGLTDHRTNELTNGECFHFHKASLIRVSDICCNNGMSRLEASGCH